jgi:hypothetical protein
MLMERIGEEYAGEEIIFYFLGSDLEEYII